jgi:PAS domain S-box-containing protein
MDRSIGPLFVMAGAITGVAVMAAWEFLVEDFLLEALDIPAWGGGAKRKWVEVAVGSLAAAALSGIVWGLARGRLAVTRALRESELRLRGIFNNMQDVYYRSDREGRIIMASPSAERLLGFGLDRIMSLPPTDLYLAPADREVFLQAMRAGSGRVVGHEVKLRRSDGTWVWAWINAQYWFDGHGKPAGIEGIIRDVTERKQAEAALRQTRDELEARVQQRTRELEAAVDLADAASRAKSEFLAVMSHELRTPLNAILGFSDVLAREMFGPLADSRYGKYARDIHDAGQVLLKHINGLLDLSQIEQRSLRLRESILDIGVLLGEAVARDEKRLAENGIALRLSAPDRMPKLRADALRVTQAVLSLIDNAIKFTPRGGTIEIRVEMNSQGGVEIIVTDTGCGISAEDLPQVVAPFARGRNPFVRQGKGLGLGLPLAKAYVEAHGGAFDLSSSPGQGTTALIRFPPGRTVQI